MQQYLMEMVGTFFLTTAIAMTGNPFAIGLMLLAMLIVGAVVTHGHYNPMLSLACWMRGGIKTEDLIGETLAQTVGALLAVGLYFTLTTNMYMPEMGAGMSLGNAVLMEGLFAAVLAWVYATVSSKAPFKGTPSAALAIALTLTAIAFIGGVYNPAVALGAMIWGSFKGAGLAGTNALLIYVGGPLLGGAVASSVYSYFSKAKKK